MRFIINFFIERSTASLSLLLFVCLAGLFVFRSMPRERTPDVKIPYISVNITQSGISPDDAETMLLQPLEDELKNIEGVKEMNGYAYENGARVMLEFLPEVELDKAMNDVTRQVNTAKGNIPKEADEPLIAEFSTGLFPQITLVLFSTADMFTVMTYAQRLKDTLQGVPSILSAETSGLYTEQTNIFTSPRVLYQYKLAPEDFSEAIGKYNQIIQAGSLDNGNGRFFVKVPSVYYTLDDIRNTPLKSVASTVLTIGDVAEVVQGIEQRGSISRSDGFPAVSFNVVKRAGYNVIKTIDDAKKIVESEMNGWSPEAKTAFKATWVQDSSVAILHMLQDLINNVLVSVFIVFLVLFINLGYRSAVLASIIVPGSILIGIIVVAMLGYTLNMMVLFAFLLSIGMLVDSSIVVLEYADRRMREGMHPRQAYMEAATRMAMPIITSMLTNVASFVPLFVWPGIVGEFMSILPKTLTILFCASLILSIIYIPVIGSIWVPKVIVLSEAEQKYEDNVKRMGIRDYILTQKDLGGKYARMLYKALSNPMRVLKVTLGVLAGTILLYSQFNKGVTFFPYVEPDFIQVSIKTQGNYSIDERDAFVKQVEERLPKTGEIKHYTTKTMVDPTSDMIGNISLELIDYDERRVAKDIIAETFKNTKDIPGIYVQIEEEKAGPASGKPIDLRLYGRDPEVLLAETQKIVKYAQTLPSMYNVDSSLPLPYMDIVAIPDKQAMAEAEVSMSDVGNMLQLSTAGSILGRYRPHGSTSQVYIRLLFGDKERNLAGMQQIQVPSKHGLAPLSNFVKLEPKRTSGMVRHVDGKRFYSITADIAAGYTLTDSTSKLEAYMKSNAIDPQVRFVFKGEAADQAEAGAFLMGAFMVALLLIASILLLQFNSFYGVMVIMSAIIMGIIGSLIGLMLLKLSFGVIMGGLGMVFLAGIVVNNNIVLLDAYQGLRKETRMGSRLALLSTGAQRFRPIMLTTTTTIIGLLPSMLKIGFDFGARKMTYNAPSSQWWVELSSIIITGLAFTTILTLFVTPSILLLTERSKVYRKYKLRGIKAKKVKERQIRRFVIFRVLFTTLDFIYSYILLSLSLVLYYVKALASVLHQTIINSRMYKIYAPIEQKVIMALYNVLMAVLKRILKVYNIIKEHIKRRKKIYISIIAAYIIFKVLMK